MSEMLRDVAEHLAEKYRVPLQEVVIACPPQVADAMRGGLGRYRRELVEDFVASWRAAVILLAKKRYAVRDEVARKRLAYFRRRYGPHICINNLPGAHCI